MLGIPLLCQQNRLLLWNCVLCYFLDLDVSKSLKQENADALLFMEVEVLYSSNTAYYIPRKNVGRSEELQKTPKQKFLFHTLKCELFVMYKFLARLKKLEMELQLP